MRDGATISLEDIAALNRDRMTSLGIHPRVRTAEVTLMQLMSYVGELATVAYRSTPLTAFEHDEVANVLGGIAVCLATLGEAYRVNVGEAAIQRLNQSLARTDLTAAANKTAKPPSSETSTASPTQPTIEGSPATALPPQLMSPKGPAPSMAAMALPQPEPDLLLSPSSRRSYFPQLDVVARFPPEQFNKLHLTWTAPQVDGRLVELIPNGMNIPVTHDQLTEYLTLVQPLRDAHRLLEDAPPALQSLPQSVAAVQSQAAAGHLQVKHVDVPAPPGYDAVEVKKMFSPTHFEHGLFSPHSTATALDVAYTEPEPRTPSDSDFAAVVRRIETGELAGQKINQLRLRFVMPLSDGKMLELLPGGSHVPLTQANSDEFVRLVREKQVTQQGRVRRTESIKRLEVANAAAYNPHAETEKFSPTHFTHNIFAPHDEKKQFFVDYDHEEDCLPEVFRQSRAVPSAQSAASPAAAPRDSSSAERTPNADSNVSGIQSYAEYLRSRGVEGLRGIVEQVERNPTALQRYHVTWCIPSSLTGRLTDEDPLYDLIVDGRSVPVQESHASLFLGMVRKYL